MKIADRLFFSTAASSSSVSLFANSGIIKLFLVDTTISGYSPRYSVGNTDNDIRFESHLSFGFIKISTGVALDDCLFYSLLGHDRSPPTLVNFQIYSKRYCDQKMLICLQLIIKWFLMFVKYNTTYSVTLLYLQQMLSTKIPNMFST
jgi:hypothetical protein